MLRAVGNWLGQGKNNKMPVNNGASIMDVHNAHIKCKVAFDNYLKSTIFKSLNQAEVCRDDKCELGRLIHGAGLEQYRMHGTFYTLRSIHAQLHIVAGNIVQLIQSNDRAAATRLFEEEYYAVSRKVLQAVTALYKQAEKK
jgi:hypothetical protein